MWLKPWDVRSGVSALGLSAFWTQVAVGAKEPDRDAVEEPRSGGRVRQALEVGQRHAVGLGQAPAAGVRAGGGTRRRERGGQRGARDERRSGDGRCALPEAGDPDLLGRPAMRPFRRHPLVARGGALGRLELVQRLDREAAAAQQRDELAVGQVELDRAVAPLERRMPNCGSASASPEGSSSSCIVSRTSGVLVRNHSHPPGRRRRAASGIHASGSHHRLAPYSEIAMSKESSGSGTASALPSMSGKSQAVLGLQRARGRELLRRHVDADRSRAAARQPRRDVGRAAAELDHVAPVDLGQRARLASGISHVPQVISSSAQWRRPAGS